MNSRRESSPKLKFLACFNFRRLPLVLSRVDCCHYGKSSQFRLNMIRFLASLAITWASDYSARQTKSHVFRKSGNTWRENGVVLVSPCAIVPFKMRNAPSKLHHKKNNKNAHPCQETYHVRAKPRGTLFYGTGPRFGKMKYPRSHTGANFT